MRYFFHVKNRGKSRHDGVGRRSININNAKAHAAVIANEFAIEAENYDGYSVCAVDENGTEVARVPIRGLKSGCWPGK